MIAKLLHKTLQRGSVEKALAKSERSALAAFKKAVKQSVYYQQLLAGKQLLPRNIKTLDDFRQQVPLTEKRCVFQNFALPDLMRTGIKGMESLMLSSGYSRGKSFSIGTSSFRERKASFRQTDVFLELFLGVKKQDTFVINCSAMGVRVFTGCAYCDTGLRSDVVAGVYQTVVSLYQNVVIVAYPNFLKKVVEDCVDLGIDFSQANVFFVTGGDWFPESQRDYIHRLTGKSLDRPSKGFWLGTFGVAELGYPLMLETLQLARIRNYLHHHPEKTKALWPGIPAKLATPFLFHYFPSRYYIEALTHEWGSELVFTTLDPKRAIPLVRYRTGDCGVFLSAGALSAVLAGQVQLPYYKLPVVGFTGRLSVGTPCAGSLVQWRDVDELLYANDAVNRAVTGNFQINPSDHQLEIYLQLKQDMPEPDAGAAKLKELLEQKMGIPISLVFVPFTQFNHQMAVDYERKFRPV